MYARAKQNSPAQWHTCTVHVLCTLCHLVALVPLFQWYYSICTLYFLTPGCSCSPLSLRWGSTVTNGTRSEKCRKRWQLKAGVAALDNFSKLVLDPDSPWLPFWSPLIWLLGSFTLPKLDLTPHQYPPRNTLTSAKSYPYPILTLFSEPWTFGSVSTLLVFSGFPLYWGAPSTLSTVNNVFRSEPSA